MKILSTNVYVGPNIYAHFPVIRHVLDLGVLEEWPTGKLGAGFIDPLLENVAGSARTRLLVPRTGRIRPTPARR